MSKYCAKILLILVAVPLSVCFVVDLSPAELVAEGELPHPAEVRLMEELAAWTGESPTSSPTRPFPESEGITSSVQAYAESFSFFRQVAGPYGRSATLATLPFGRQIERVSKWYRVDPLLVAAIISAESSFDPRATSPVGAQGLMQLMPETARYLSASLKGASLKGASLKGASPKGASTRVVAGQRASGESGPGELDGDNPLSADPLAADPMSNLELGVMYVKRLMKLYGDDIPLTLAAYNSGPGNVRKFGGIPPFSETQKYVEKVLAGYIDLQNAAFTADRFLAAELDSASVAGSM